MPIIYPQGKPHEILCMEGGGDCIFQEVNATAGAIEKAIEKYGSRVPPLVAKAAQMAGVSASFLYFVLYQPPGLWPPSISAKNQQVLRFIAQVGLFYRLPSDLKRHMRVTKRDIASNEELIQAMNLLAQMGARNIIKPLAGNIKPIAQESVKTIQVLCEKVYGEKCSFSEAQKILFGDMRRGLKHRRLDVDSPNAIEAFLSL